MNKWELYSLSNTINSLLYGDSKSIKTFHNHDDIPKWLHEKGDQTKCYMVKHIVDRKTKWVDAKTPTHVYRIPFVEQWYFERPPAAVPPEVDECMSHYKWTRLDYAKPEEFAHAMLPNVHICTRIHDKEGYFVGPPKSGLNLEFQSLYK